MKIIEESYWQFSVIISLQHSSRRILKPNIWNLLRIRELSYASSNTSSRNTLQCCFSNSNVIKITLRAYYTEFCPPPQRFWFCRSGVGTKICFSGKFHGDVYAGLRTILFVVLLYSIRRYCSTCSLISFILCMNFIPFPLLLL